MFILHQPTRKPTPNTRPGSSICTRSPDYGCYKSGWPACCDSDYTCPSFMTMCDNVASGVGGNNFCGSWAPDYGCWPSTHGRPPCCSKSGGAYVNCPPSDSVEKYQPCESEITETEWRWSSDQCGEEYLSFVTAHWTLRGSSCGVLSCLFPFTRSSLSTQSVNLVERGSEMHSS